MHNIFSLEPKEVFDFFTEISAIPHGSGNTKQIGDYLEKFALSRNLEHYRDKLNNVIIIKEATKGYENAPSVIIQGHTDMVCEKSVDCDKDMAKEGLDLKTDGEYLYADKTSLGGDDGIAVAMALAILDSKTLCHPRIEAVFTVDEEIGMLGATGLDVTPLTGKLMFNIDSEDEGIFTVSCAGGNVTTCDFEFKREDFSGDVFEIEISGLCGGHSGIEIDKMRANSNVLMGRILNKLCENAQIRIISVNGGLKDNAIPVNTKLCFVAENGEIIESVAEYMQKVFKSEYEATDGNISVEIKNCEYKTPFDKEGTEKICCLLATMPNGVMEMSPYVKGLVQTSLNLGIVDTKDNQFKMSFCVRSSVETQKEMVSSKIISLAEVLGGRVTVTGDYPGWQYNPDSYTRSLLVETYLEMYGKEPEIVAIHAGVECGIFAGKIKGLDCISFGPELIDIHTCRERMNIPSVERTWRLLTGTLKKIK